MQNRRQRQIIHQTDLFPEIPDNATPEQVEDEIAEVLRFSLSIWKTFGFTEIKPYLATRPEKAVGDPARWEKAIYSLEKAVEKAGLSCVVDAGGGAFYGPKIDCQIKHCTDSKHQLAIIQSDKYAKSIVSMLKLQKESLTVVTPFIAKTLNKSPAHPRHPHHW